MKKFARLATVFILCMTFMQCSNDDAVENSGTITLNGTDFALGTNSSTVIFNRNKSISNTNLWLEIVENTTQNARTISIFANHEAGTRTKIYILRNNETGPGIAIPAVLDEESGEQISGGSLDNQPTGTIAITSQGGGRYDLEFNNVVLDPGTETQTTINGSCSRKFKIQP